MWLLPSTLNELIVKSAVGPLGVGGTAVPAVGSAVGSAVVTSGGAAGAESGSASGGTAAGATQGT